MELRVPGIFLRGGIVLALGLAATACLLVRTRLPGFLILLAVAAGAAAASDLYRIATETRATLVKLQHSLADLNRVLATVQLPEIELFDRSKDGWSYLDYGIWVALAGAGLLLLGAWLEALVLAAGRRGLLSVLVGHPVCRSCRHPVGMEMSFCPGCGKRLGDHVPCRACQRPVPRGYRFCPDCGNATDPA
ncbi:MAG: zinc ribbon domain-containing protein [Candidatus Eremiobacterota bacterium]